MIETEILVIGAGPSGSAAAQRLAELGHEVLMVDAAAFPRDKTCGDGLPPMAIKTMQEMGILNRVEAAGATRVLHTSMIMPDRQRVRIGFEEVLGESVYALVLPRLQLDDVLRRCALDAGARYLGETRVRALHREGNRITEIKAERQGELLRIRARWVLVAVGANIGFLKRHGLLPGEVQPILAARAYYTGVSPAPTDYSFIFDKDLMPGYGWVFPTGAGEANIGVGEQPGERPRPARRLQADFITRLERDGLLQSHTQAGPVKGYPIRIDFPPPGPLSGENWMLIGEAAGLVNPSTGEGIDLAMESGLIAAHALHTDPRRYDRLIRARYAAMFHLLRVARDVFMTRAHRMNRIGDLIAASDFVAERVVRVVQGFEPATVMFHPLLIGMYLRERLRG